MNNLTFQDSKALYKVTISKKLMKYIQKLCHQSLPNETGGILIGYYTDKLNLAVVTKILNAPADSRSGPTWFYRGTSGIKKSLDTLWKSKKQFYIGEWHYHPNSSSNLSYQDIKQMKFIANSPSYNCPEPILLIIGGNDLKWEESIYIFTKGKEYIYLR
ncbi:Mov34/MPN/PAD-1 family protein [Priestia koreensis]|uniref:Mov34/MPN/PAD-1 family protein n=1 Tax=Priestia koreensis TaxID=284581 RepID=UPI003019CF9A